MAALAAALSLVAASALVLIPSPPATAAAVDVAPRGVVSPPVRAMVSYGAGEWFGSNYAGNFVMPDGSRGYCLDSSAEAPIGVDMTPVVVSNLGSLSASQTAGISWVIATHGQTADDAQASIVARAIWVALGQESSSNAAVNALAAQILAYSPPTIAGTGVVNLTLTTDAADNYKGTLHIDSMDLPGATGTIALTNGVFTDTGSTTLAGTFTAGMTFDVTGVPPTADGAPYKISAATVAPGLSSPVAAGFAGVTAWVNGSWQTLGTSHVGTAAYLLNGSTVDPFVRFVPMSVGVATALVRHSYAPGDPITDQLTLSLDAGQWVDTVEGEPVPVSVILTRYCLPPGYTVVTQSAAPADVGAGESVTLDVTGAGVAVPVTLPGCADVGTVVVQACVVASVFVDAACDSWGVQAEMASVAVPLLAATGALGATTGPLLIGGTAGALLGLALLLLPTVLRRAAAR